MFLVFTDLDGTLLDHDSYSWEPARPAIRRLIDARIPWIFVTSKTRAETEVWRTRTGNQHPFIVENGGAAFVPIGYFPTPVPGAIHLDRFELLEFGSPYVKLAAELHAASELAKCRIRSFSEMPVEGVARACGLPIDLAHLAKQREYDEPFIVIDREGESALIEAIGARGFRCTRGGRFWHITGANDKGAAVQALERLYRQSFGPLKTIGLGDGLNDVPFLRHVSVPIVIRSAQSGELQKLLPNALVTTQYGPAGWAEALLQTIPEL